MELWIRSQDREQLVLSKHIYYTEHDRDYYGKECVLVEENVGVIGSYNIKERALEVLDEIHKILNNEPIKRDSYGNDVYSKNVYYMPID